MHHHMVGFNGVYVHLVIAGVDVRCALVICLRHIVKQARKSSKFTHPVPMKLRQLIQRCVGTSTGAAQLFGDLPLAVTLVVTCRMAS